MQRSGAYTDAIASHNDHCAGLQLSLIPLQKFPHRGYLLVNPHLYEPHDCLMRTTVDKDELPEVLVRGHDDSAFQ